jgi:hypothetical protein
VKPPSAHPAHTATLLLLLPLLLLLLLLPLLLLPLLLLPLLLLPLPPHQLTRSVTASLCPLNLHSPASPTTSHTTSVVSADPDASSAPSLLKRRAVTAPE